VIVTMPPESVDEAIRLAADEKATARFLDASVVQTRAGSASDVPSLTLNSASDHLLTASKLYRESFRNAFLFQSLRPAA